MKRSGQGCQLKKYMYKPSLTVDLEITNHCNAHCFMCPRESIKDFGFMSGETFQKIILRLKDYGKIIDLSFCGNGEPLLHKEILDFVAYAAKNKFHTTLVTNGSLLTQETTEKLIKAGLKSINVSFSSNNPETYAKIHCGLCFDTVKQNIEEAIRVAREKQVRINLQISPTKFNAAELHNFVEYWYKKGIGFCFVIDELNSRGGNIEIKDGFLPLEKKSFKFHPDAIPLGELFRPEKRHYKYIMQNVKLPCIIKQIILYIDWRGNYLLCSMDFAKEYILGNVDKNLVENVNKIKEGLRLEDLRLCKNCNVRENAAAIRPRDISFYLGLAKIKLKNLVRRI